MNQLDTATIDPKRIEEVVTGRRGMVVVSASARILAERLEDATKQVGIEFVTLQKSNFDPRVVGLLPQSFHIVARKITRPAAIGSSTRFNLS
jgi:ribose 1,5-bisphosphokinase PhnN